MDYVIEYNKILRYFKILNIWLAEKQRDRSVVSYMKKKGYSRVAIYGMRELGERLYDELVDGGIEVAYVIDQSNAVLGDFLLYKPDDELPYVDLIIVTADYYYDEIYQRLHSRVDCPITSISGLLGDAFGAMM